MKNLPLPARRILITLALVLLALGGVQFLRNRGTVSTDDAFLEAHIHQVSSKISEKIAAVHAEDNQTVEKGDLLVELETKDTEALVAQAKAHVATCEAKLAQAVAQKAAAGAELEQARADVAEARAPADNAAQELTRSRSLRDSGAVSQRELDLAVANESQARAALAGKMQKVAASTSQVAVAHAAVNAAKAQVDQAVALLDTARIRLANTKIFAPAAGRITRRSAEPGNFVQPGFPLMAVVAPDVWVVANFKETQLARMRPGQPVEIGVDSYPGLALHGHVESIQSGTGSRFSLLPAENATGNFVKVVQRVPVKIVLDPVGNPPLLAPGMSVSPTVTVR